MKDTEPIDSTVGGVKAAYSYGISGYDQWGCDVSTRLAVPVASASARM